jgi:hypothetical protein
VSSRLRPRALVATRSSPAAILAARSQELGRNRLEARDAVKHDTYHVAEVQAGRHVPSSGRVGVDVNPATGGENSAECVGPRRSRVNTVRWPQNRPTVRPFEDHADIGMSADREGAVVEAAVVEMTQRHEVVQVGVRAKWPPWCPSIHECMLGRPDEVTSRGVRASCRISGNHITTFTGLTEVMFVRSTPVVHRRPNGSPVGRGERGGSA